MTDSIRFAWRRLVVRDPHLTDATRRVLLELESYADPDGTNAHPGVERIATQLRTPEGKVGHVSDRTVRTALATGVERGFVELTAKAPKRRGNKLSDVYALTFPPEVRAATQSAGLSEADRAATQSAGLNDSYTGNQSELDRQSEAVRPAIAIADHQSLNTRSLTPDPNLARLSDAHAPASGNGTDLADSLQGLFGGPDAAPLKQHGEPVFDSEPVTAERVTRSLDTAHGVEDPLSWIRHAIGVLSEDEATEAKQLLAESTSRYEIVRKIRGDRQRSRRSPAALANGRRP